MACSKSFAIGPTEDPMPLDDAVVIADTIYGTMGPYVMKFNGSTGALISSVRVAAPMVGPCRITQLGGILYVATWNNPAADIDPAAFPADWFFGRGIAPVNPTTMAVGAFIEMAQLANFSVCSWDEPMRNIRCLLGSGSYLYVVYGSASSNMVRLNPVTLAHVNSCAYDGSGLTESLIETIAADATHLYMPDPDNRRFQQFLISSFTDAGSANTRDTSPAIGLNQIRSVATTAANTVYGVCGNSANLVKYVFPSPGTSTIFNLATVQAGVRPFRLRYNSNDGLLYIPCQGQDGVIVWNPATNTGIWKSGFVSPIDCVFTASKKWAIQNSSKGVLEIT